MFTDTREGDGECRARPAQEIKRLSDNTNDQKPSDHQQAQPHAPRHRRRRRRPNPQPQADQQQGAVTPQQQQQAPGQQREKQGQGGQGGQRRGRRPAGERSERQEQAQPQGHAQGERQRQRQPRQGTGSREAEHLRRQQVAEGRKREAQQPSDAQQQAQSRRRPVRRPRRDDEAPERVDAKGMSSRARMQPGGAGYSVVGPIGADTLRVIPLGGVGEVGKNMTAVECGSDLVLLDAGGKFPEEEQRGIDLIVPDITFILERQKNFRGILLTHGHEDHIGGLPHIIPQLKGKTPIPIYGTPLALGFVERKLMEARLEKFVDLRTVESGSKVQFGQNITAEFIHVTHSIPDACAIALHTPVGTIVDTGDFKFDPTPVMGAPTDEKLLRRIGEKGILALFSDTVRVESEGSTPSEKVVQDTIDRVVGQAKGQVIIATFASNVSRIHMALHAAAKHGRKVAVAGRSMEQNARVALDLGYLDPPEGLFVSLEDLLRMPKEKRVIVSTGSQGEVSAALARIAAGEHPKIRVSRGDTVLVSATPIPGNEETVSNTINNLFRQGCDVVYSALDRGVHVSGHAGRDELQRMIRLLKPTYAVPIHGEFRHMALYRELAIKNGVRRDHVLLPEIGGVIEFTAKGANQRGRVKAGNILVDRLGERGDGQVKLRTRENLTEDGFVVVTIVLDRQSGELIAGPELVGRGLSKELNNGALKEAERELRRMLERRKQGSPQYGYVMQRTKETVGKALFRRSRSRPLILPVVTEL